VAYFGARHFGTRYYGERYWGGGATIAVGDGKYYGNRYFGPRYFGPRYWGTDGADAPTGNGTYYGSRYFGPPYYGPRYWGTTRHDIDDGTLPVTPPPTAGGSIGVGSSAWRGYNQSRKRRKKDALEELDYLLAQVRAQIIPQSRDRTDELLIEALKRGNAVSLKNTIVQIEAEIISTRELLAEIDDEEALLLLF
jgi:hypothetical protein